MGKYIVLLLISLCSIQCSLNREKNSDLVFNTKRSVIFKGVSYPDILGITMQLIKIDILLLINDFHGDTLVNVFNLNTNKLEKKLIIKGNGPDELISPLDIQVLGNKLYIQCRPKFSLNHIDVESIWDKTVIHKDAQLPQKSDRFLPLSDSLFIFSGLWNKRYALLDLNLPEKIMEFGDYPNYWSEEESIPTEAKAMFHQCRFVKHPQKPLFVSCSSYVLEVYGYDPKGKHLPTLNWKKQLGKYSYDFTIAAIITANEKNGVDPKALELACTEKYIYVVKESGIFDNKCIIMVLDWDGNPIEQLICDKKITCLTIDEDKQQGYCIIEDPEDKLVFFDLE